MNTNYTLFKTTLVALFFTYTSWSQATIAQWNFNGASATEVAGGATSPQVSLGTGTAQLVGAATATFDSGNTTAGTLETETTSPPNFSWNTEGYAAAATDNKGRGVQFNVSTVGQAGIVFKFEQRLSNSANNTYIVLYTADRTAGTPTWIEAQTFTFTPAATGTGDTWYNSTLRTVDVSGVTALDNNPNVAFRVVSAFDPVAGDYVAARSTNVYSAGTGGKVRYEMVTITSNTTLGTAAFESAKSNFKMFPNPSKKEIVQFNAAQDVSVFDILGKLILKANNTTRIDTKSFRSGVYVVKTKTGITRKLIVK